MPRANKKTWVDGSSPYLSAENLNALETDLDGLFPAGDSFQLISQKGNANGYAGLGSDGKVPSAQLPALGGGIGSIDGVTPATAGGNIDLVAGTNITITPDDAADSITIAAASGGGGVTLVEDVAALRASSPAAGAKIHLAGYYSPGDGGSGNFYVDGADTTTVDDGGFVFVAANGARVKREIDDRVDVRWYGAKGDNATNDNAAFLSAVAKANSSERFRHFRIPGGLYLANGPLVLNYRVQVKGDGSSSNGSTWIAHHGTNALFESLTHDDSNKGSLKIEGLTITAATGTADTSATAAGIRIGNITRSVIRDVQVFGYTAGNGIHLLNSTHWTEQTLIDHVRVENCLNCLHLERTAGTDSYAGLKIKDSVFLPNVAGATGILVGSNTLVYGATIEAKMHTYIANCTGLKMLTGAQIRNTRMQILCEGTVADSGVPLKLEGNAVLKAIGNIELLDAAGYPQGESIASGATLRLSERDLSARIGTEVFTNGNTVDEYRFIGTLPATSTGTRDKLRVELEGGYNWISGLSNDWFEFTNRESFQYAFEQKGPGGPNGRSNVRVVCYREGLAGTAVHVYLRMLGQTGGSFLKANIRAYGSPLNLEAGRTVTSTNGAGKGSPVPLSITNANAAAPTGTLVFDSGDAAYLSSAIPTIVPILGERVVVTDMAAAIVASTSYKAIADLSNATQFRTSIVVAAAGSTSAVFRVQYSTDDFTWVELGDIASTNMSISSTGVKKTNWLTIPSGARGDVYLRYVREGGDAVADPDVSNLYLHYR